LIFQKRLISQKKVIFAGSYKRVTKGDVMMYSSVRSSEQKMKHG